MSAMIWRTMLEITGETQTNNENVRPPRRAPSEKNRANIDIVINMLRRVREGTFTSRNKLRFGRHPLRLEPTLPLPDLEIDCGCAPWSLSVEHLQDFCNKSTAIYCTSMAIDFTPMYEFILGKWSRGDVHRLDIEFARFFAKLVDLSSWPPPTIQQVVMMHEALCDASGAAHATGFFKEDNDTWLRDVNFIGGYQVEFYSIKPLLRALIIVIENPKPEYGPSFEKQEVRLVRTGCTTGLRWPITFDSLVILNKINENEVVTTLPEAVRFVMDLDGREDALLEKRDNKTLDLSFGLPKVHLKQHFSDPSKSHRFWTGEDTDIPVGPATDWWKDGLTDKNGNPIQTSPKRKRGVRD